MSRHEKPRILIIASSFAPSTFVGAKRFTFLSPILKKRYEKLDILTRKKKYFPSKDYSLPIAGTVHRVGMYPPWPIRTNHLIGRVYNNLWLDYLCIIDSCSGWILPSLFKGINIIKSKKIDLVIATCPRFSSIVIGYLISRITNTKLVIDYRDPWTNHHHKFCKFFGRRIGQVFEKNAVKHASAIVFCTKFMKKKFMGCMGKYTNAICRIIHSGYHNGDAVQPFSLGENRKNMIYAGRLSGERGMELLAKPLYQLLDKGLINKNNFCFHHFGQFNDEDREIIDYYGLQEIVKRHAPVNYEQMLKYLKGGDILVLLSGSDVSYAIPFKFYDYLRVKRPILAVAPENSAVAEMMQEIDCGRLAIINNEVSILVNLRAMLFEEKEYSFSGSENYTWEKAGNSYLELIDEVCGQ